MSRRAKVHVAYTNSVPDFHDTGYGAPRPPSPSCVRRVGRPPSTGMVYISVGPSYEAVKAMLFPSGESTGASSRPRCVVNRCATPPPTATFHRSPSA